MDAAAMCFYSVSFCLFNLVKIDETEVSFSNGSGQEGNVYTGQIHTTSNDEVCVERLASSQPELVTYIYTHRNPHFININLLCCAHLQEINR